MSVTVTLKQHVEELPESSVAVQQTRVVPIGKVLPEAWSQVTVGFGSHASVAVTVNVTVAPLALVHSVVLSGGQWIMGGVVSVTVTLKQQRDELPE